MIKTVTLNPAVDKTLEIENFCVGAVNRIASVRLDAGGKGINVSKSIKALGGNSTAMGILAGTMGEYVKGYLDNSGIENEFIFIGGETRTNIKIVDKMNHTTTDINESGADIPHEALKLLEKRIFSDLDEGSILVLSGSAPDNVSKAIYREWTETAKKSGARVLLDSAGELLLEGIKAGPYLIKPNISELEQLCGRKLDGITGITAAAESLMDNGIKIVVVSLGAEGALFISRDKAIHIGGIPVNVRSTVGSGDAMVAALAVALSWGYSFERAAALSVAAGTANAVIPGTQPPKLEDVLYYEKQVYLGHLI